MGWKLNSELDVFMGGKILFVLFELDKRYLVLILNFLEELVDKNVFWVLFI
jgi:hypothetical protein